MIIQALLSILLCSVIYVGASTGCDCDCHWILPNGEPLPAKSGPYTCDCSKPPEHNTISKRRPRHQEWTWGPVQRHHNFQAPILPTPQNNDLFAIYYEPADTFTAATFYPFQTSAANPSGSVDVFHPQEPAANFNPEGIVPYNPQESTTAYNPESIYNPVGTTAIFNAPGSIENFYPLGYLPNVHPYYGLRNAVSHRKNHNLIKSTPISALDNDPSESGIRESFMDLSITDVNENDLARAKLPNTENGYSPFMNCMDLHLALAQMQSTQPILSQPWNRENINGLNSIEDIKNRIKILCKHSERTIQENVQAIIDGNPLRSEFRVSDSGVNTAAISTGLSSFYGESADNEISDDSDKHHVKNIGSIPIEKSDNEQSNEFEKSNESRDDVPATTESTLITTTVDDEQDTTTEIITSTESNTAYDVALNLKDNEVSLRADSDEVYSFSASDSSAESKQNTNEMSIIEDHNFVNLTKELEDLSETLSRDQLKKIFSGRMEFVHNKERIPLEFAQNKDGSIDLGIDGDYLCKRLLEGPEKYIILKAICNSKPPASEKSDDYK